MTMRDVAEKANVSIKTVSRVVNNQGEISETTRQRVLDAIRQLGYRPNIVARGLASGRTASVALIIPQITDPFFPELVLGVESVAHRQGYSVFLCNTNEDPQQELDYIDILSGKQVDGIILCGSRLDAEQLSAVATRHHVAILTSRRPAHAAVVSIPGRTGLRRMTSHLAELGHRKIGYVGLYWPGDQERLQGYYDGLAAHGIGANDRYVRMLPTITVDLARHMTRDLLHAAPEITAIACYNDLAALGVMQAAASLGRKAPEDLAVVGFDDIPLASLVSPQLTTMHVPKYMLGQMVMDLLLKVIAAKGDYEEHAYVELRMIVRESCGAKNRLPVG
ncbi:MAG: LacI family DNA-binding transcriptional regulator [Chloroflexota bacterium]|nr:LacI family DNA-binding transcriptional regulator [Chloroflexota bacterium]